jgi:hypothetical protein
MSFAELPHPAIEQAIMTAMPSTHPLIRFVTIVPPYFSVPMIKQTAILRRGFRITGNTIVARLAAMPPGALSGGHFFAGS